MEQQQLKEFLFSKAIQYNNTQFIANDPIVIPHTFTKPADIEIAGFFAALLAWGNRTSIINSCKKLLQIMNNAPHEFIMHWPQNAKEKYVHINAFVHRTFNGSDLFFVCSVLHYHYAIQKQKSLETAFTNCKPYSYPNVEQALNNFYSFCFSSHIHGIEFEKRTQKHIAAPFKKSACKRLNMYLRWMVRKDKNGVDFGIWKTIQPHQLICPLDVHVARVAKRFNLIQENNANWITAVELTSYLKKLNPSDPVLFDFALFGLGVVEKY
jgi:uncharacterized protein (TIGR02757 family)